VLFNQLVYRTVHTHCVIILVLSCNSYIPVHSQVQQESDKNRILPHPRREPNEWVCWLFLEWILLPLLDGFVTLSESLIFDCVLGMNQSPLSFSLHLRLFVGWLGSTIPESRRRRETLLIGPSLIWETGWSYSNSLFSWLDLMLTDLLNLRRLVLFKQLILFSLLDLMLTDLLNLGYSNTLF